MRIRLRGNKDGATVAPGLVSDSDELTEGAASVAGRVVSHRQFLKTLAAAVGLAGLGQVAAKPQSAAATYITGVDGDTVDTQLTVQGDLYVSGGRLMFSDANGTAFPQNWVGMVDWVDSDSKWLHIGGIYGTSTAEPITAYRRLGLWAQRIYLQGDVGLGTLRPQAKLHLADGAIRIGTRVVADSGGCYYA